MNNSYLERAKKVITDPKILSIVAGKRARQLAWGARPMLKCDSANYLDIALLEIAEGKLYYTEGSGNSEVDIFAAITASTGVGGRVSGIPGDDDEEEYEEEEEYKEEYGDGYGEEYGDDEK